MINNIELLQDNILVTELVSNTRAGALSVLQDSSSAYMFCKVENISYEALHELAGESITSSGKAKCNQFKQDLISGDIILVIRRVAKDPFIQNKFFISHKDIRAMITKKYFEEM